MSFINVFNLKRERRIQRILTSSCCLRIENNFSVYFESFHSSGNLLKFYRRTTGGNSPRKLS